MRLIAAAKFTNDGIGIRSCLENFGARQPGDGDATVPSLSEGSEDVTSVSTEVNSDSPRLLKNRRLMKAGGCFVLRLMVSTEFKDAKDTKSPCLAPKFTQQLTTNFSQPHIGHPPQIR
jgi:hypothetical protein